MNKNTMNSMVGDMWKVALGLIIIGLIGMAFYKFDFSSTEGKASMDKIWEFSEHELKHLEVFGGSNNINVSFISIPSDAHAYVQIEGNAREEVISRIEATELINQKLSLDLRENNWHLFSFGFFTDRKIDISVALPDQAKLDTAHFHVSSGNGHYNDVKGESIQIETTSGNARFNNLEAKHISLKCTSGNINGSGLVGESHIACTSGNVNIDRIAGDANASVTSGNMTLKQSTSANANVNATSGNVRFEAAPDFAGFYDLRATSGNIKAPDSPRLTDQTIAIRTKSGNIRVTQ